MNKLFTVNYFRDGLIEEFHEGVLQYGFDSNNTTPYYLRSCAKPLQASLLIDYGIDFSEEELAFCSGSHAGEECHVKVAKGILKKLGIDESYLKCGIHPPLSRRMQDSMLLKGECPSTIHNNCSGKHLGFLAICLKKGWDPDTYYLPDHPLQIEVKRKIYELCGVEREYPLTTDGCGVPIVSMPLNNIITGYKNLVYKYPQIVNAIIENPYIFGGENRLDTEIIQNSENILAKVGAGGLCVVYNTKEDNGLVVKLEDASIAARRVAVLELLKRLNWAEIPYDDKIRTISGKEVGHIMIRIDNS